MLFQKWFHVIVIHIGIRWCWLVCLSRAFPVINRVGGIPVNSLFIYSQCTSVGLLAQCSTQRDPEHNCVYCIVCTKKCTFLGWNRLKCILKQQCKNISTFRSSLFDYSVPVRYQLWVFSIAFGISMWLESSFTIHPVLGLCLFRSVKNPHESNLQLT